MQVPLSWLKKYVPVALPAKELAHRLTMAGTEIAGVHEVGATWDRDKVIVAHVLRVERHPNADRLTLPTVDLGGGETATVVCGGPNLAVGQKVAYAREGARLYSTRSGKVEALKASKIRGVLSPGMVCSKVELGIGEDHTGILVLDDGAPLGMPLVDYLGDAILEADITPNRPDCLSVLGIAREVAAITGEKVAEPESEYAELGDPIEEQVKIEIADPELCLRYAASLISGVKVGPSPPWLRDALEKAGLRSINNVVDATNYVMLEYGQPLHAFDLELIRDRTVIVRAARPGEKIESLDDEILELRPPMLAIADSRDPIALAGVIGGTSTAVSEGTTSILLESASFDPVNTRRTASALRQSTEASHRFERGIRADLVPRALRRATRIILQEAGGQAARGIVDLYPGRGPEPVVRITPGRIRRVLGIDLDRERVASTLESLGFEPARPPRGASTEDDSAAWFKVPYWRSDIAVEDDLLEEIARIIGYDSIPTTTLSTSIPHHTPRPEREMRERVSDALAAMGLQEIISYSLSDRETLEAVEALADGTEPLTVANPMSGKHLHLRTSLRGSALATLASNRRVVRAEGLRLFELGRVYLPRMDAGKEDLPDEREMLVGVISGPRFPTSWLADQEPMGFFDAKGIVESLMGQLGIEIDYEPSTDPIMHPGKTARLVSAHRAVGVVGEVRQRVLGRFDLDESAVAMFEIDMDSLGQAMSTAPGRYAATGRFPDSERDMALIVDATVPSAAIQSIIEGHKLVRSSRPFDVYTGEGVPAGKKSIAYRVVFQSPRGTLTAEQVSRAQGDIVGQLVHRLGAELRS